MGIAERLDILDRIARLRFEVGKTCKSYFLGEVDLKAIGPAGYVYRVRGNGGPLKYVYGEDPKDTAARFVATLAAHHPNIHAQGSSNPFLLSSAEYVFYGSSPEKLVVCGSSFFRARLVSLLDKFESKRRHEQEIIDTDHLKAVKINFEHSARECLQKGVPSSELERVLSHLIVENVLEG